MSGRGAWLECWLKHWNKWSMDYFLQQNMNYNLILYKGISFGAVSTLSLSTATKNYFSCMLYEWPN